MNDYDLRLNWKALLACIEGATIKRALMASGIYPNENKKKPPHKRRREEEQ